MDSARRFYRLHLGVSLLGAAAVVGALLAVARVVSFELPSAAAIGAACRRALPSHLTLGGAMALALIALGLIVVARGVRALRRHREAERRFMQRVPVERDETVAGEHILVLASAQPLAFCAGNLRPRVYLSRAAVSGLSSAELAAVVAHERHHRLRHDPLRILAGRVLAEALFFLPVLGRLGERYVALAELAADDAALRRSDGDRGALASALLRFSESPSQAVVGIAPERVDHLLGERPRWKVPALLLGASLVAVGMVAVAAALMGYGMAGDALNLPLFLVQSCMLVMVAGPLLLAAGMAAFSHRLLARRSRR